MILGNAQIVHFAGNNLVPSNPPTLSNPTKSRVTEEGYFQDELLYVHSSAKVTQ